MKRTLIFIGFLNLSGLLYCQFNSFNLSDFKLPDIRRNQLEVNIESQFESHYSMNELENDTSKYRWRSYSDNSGLNYSSYMNTEKYQGSRSLSLGFRPAGTISRRDDGKDNDLHFNPYIYLGSQNRFYNSNHFFLEAGLMAMGNQYNYTRNRESNEYSGKSNQSNIDVEIPLAAGYGRIEQVHDARLAIYILEELQKSGKLAVVPDLNEITEFASFIALLKNERYFDYRLRRMEEIEKVDSFMQARGWVNQADARYYTTVFDNWEYADGPPRGSGKRLSAGFMPFFGMEDNYQKTKENNLVISNELERNSSSGIEIFSNYILEKPVNLHWQTGLNARISYAHANIHNFYKNKIDDSESSHKYNRNIITGKAGYSVGYYPNSRTFARADISILANNYQYKDHDLAGTKNSIYIHPAFNLNVIYYISERSGLSLNYYTSYYFNKAEFISTGSDTKNKQFWQSAKINYIYKIF